jgi:hypothetical protein
MTRWNSSGVVCSNGATSSTAAACTHVSSRPYSVTARCATRRIWAGSVTSATSAHASPPPARISSTSDRSPASPRAATTTFAPCAANPAAVARPIPLEAPITTTTCSRNGFRCGFGMPAPYPVSHGATRPPPDVVHPTVAGRGREDPRAVPVLRLLQQVRAVHRLRARSAASSVVRLRQAGDAAVTGGYCTGGVQQPRIGTSLRDSGGARIPGYLMCHTAVWRS